MNRRTPRLAVGVVAFIVTAVFAQAAWAGWLDTGNGAGSARARSLALTGNVPTVGASGGDVTVSWPQSTFVTAFLGTYSGGGYRVRRYDTGGTLQTTQAACNVVVSGSAATLSCIEHNVPTGTWRYGVTPVLGAWTGTESTRTLVVVDAPPALVSLEMKDVSGNGKVDHVIATFSEPLASSTATAPWTLTNVPSGGTLASVSVSTTIATLTITEGAGAANTAVGSFTVALAASATGIRDAAGNQSSFAATSPADKAPPARIALDMKDVSGNGKVDQVVATFSETLASYSAGTTPWTLANVPSGGTLSSVSVGGTTATLTITEGAGAANTAVGTFTVTMTANANGVRDAVGNQSSFTAIAPTDKAAPVATAVVLANANGAVAENDSVAVTFSEALSVASLCSTWSNDGVSPQPVSGKDNVVVTVAESGANDVLTVIAASCTIRFGQLALGSDYVSATVNFSGNGSHVSTFGWDASAHILTISLGSGTGQRTGVAAGTVTYTPAAGITDPAGNGVGAGGVSFSGQRF